MTDTIKPETAEQLRDAVAWAAAEETPLEVVGAGSKRGYGRPIQTAHTLDLSRLTGITLYEPDELVLSAQAGTPLAEIRQALEERNQQLAFEPPDLSMLYGEPAGVGTLGGLIATNLAGPRRVMAGAARDYFLGFSGVSGRGETFKSGGRVMKNVTGYDLSKLLCGSFGTLAAMTELTLKVLPAPEKSRSVLVFGLDDAEACSAMTRALGSSYEVSGAAHLPAAVAGESDVSYVAQAGGAVTALRLEGFGPSVEYRCSKLRSLLADLGPTEELHSHNSNALWREIGDLRPFVARPELAVWRLSVAPQAGPAVVAALLASLPQALYYSDWGGGLLWVGVAAQDDAAAAQVRAALPAPGDGAGGGHATLLRAPAELRAGLEVFQPMDAAKQALVARIKDGFDPRRVLNPGRMYAGV
ncbi:MAG: glycolate oxidase subunit GlcE [Kiloniellales bacterium]